MKDRKPGSLPKPSRSPQHSVAGSIGRFVGKPPKRVLSLLLVLGLVLAIPTLANEGSRVQLETVEKIEWQSLGFRQGPNPYYNTTWSFSNDGTLEAAAINWSCTPFEGEGSLQSDCDAKLDLEVLQSDRSGEWQIIAGEDQTHLSRGDRDATVTAAAENPEHAVFRITLSIITEDPEMLESGAYSTTVTATVTGY